MKKSDTTTITIGPSVNNMYANVPGKGRRKTGAYKVWQDSVQLYLALTLRAVSGPVRIHYMFNLAPTFRGDLSNRIKALEDALVNAGVIDGDTFNTVVGGTFEHCRTDDKESSVTIKIEKV